MKKHSVALLLVLLMIAADLFGTIDPSNLAEQEKLLAGRIEWEGFNPASIPALLFDGINSYLINHPAPPTDFKEYDKTAGIYFSPGRYPELKANTAVEINGIKTACLDLEISKIPDITEITALLLHEKFHVYQLTKHPEWWGIANEMASFEYPAEDSKLLMFVYLEIRALTNACNAKTTEDAECWAKRAVEIRSMRYAILSESCIAYERGIELVEGTAQYIQTRASGSGIEKYMTKEMMQPDRVRARGYINGAMICLLLDRLHPAWKEEIKIKDANFPDVILKNTLSKSSGTCAFDPNMMNRQSTAANNAVDEYLMKKLKLLDDFLAKPGFKIILDCSKNPMMPAGFDPMNIEKISPNELLHKRWLKLSNNTAAIEVMNLESLSEGAGGHPMFRGIKQVIVAGLTILPVIRETDGKIEFKTENISAVILKADVEKKDKTLFIRLK
jgi:hypothetical protein